MVERYLGRGKMDFYTGSEKEGRPKRNDNAPMVPTCAVQKGPNVGYTKKVVNGGMGDSYGNNPANNTDRDFD